jgi:hypothetical protein
VLDTTPCQHTKTEYKMILASTTIQVLAILVSSHVSVRYNNLLISNQKWSENYKDGTIVQVFSVSIEKLVSETKNNLNENLSFGTILLSEQVSESCSINIFNQFLTRAEVGKYLLK